MSELDGTVNQDNQNSSVTEDAPTFVESEDSLGLEKVKPVNYQDLIEEAEKPVKKRNNVHNTRLQRNITVRRHHCLDEKLEKYKEQWEATGKYVPPFNRSGAYYGFIQALVELDINKWHIFIDVRKKMEEVMDSIPSSKKGKSAWQMFEGRKSDRDTSKDLNGKIVQNAKVLQRVVDFSKDTNNLNPYGYKLQQLCSCIDIKKDSSGNVFFRLNTKFPDKESVVPERGLNTRKSK